MPMFLVALAVVILYQVYTRKKAQNSDSLGIDEEGIASKIARKAGGKLSAKARSELAEIDAMERSLKGMANQGFSNFDKYR
jgi:hypothetical protein